MHNAALMSDGVVKTICLSKYTLPTDTSEGKLPTPISVVDDVVFHGYKRGHRTIGHAY